MIKFWHYIRTHYKTYLLIVLFCGISYTLFSISTEQLVTTISTNNAYVIMFILAIIGGLTTFSGIPYHFVLMGFASAGVNPIMLGLVTGIGVMIGDSISYLVGYQGQQLLPERIKQPLKHISDYLTHHPRLVFPALFIYGTLSPLSNDFIVISMGLARFSYRKVIIPLTCGNMIYNVALAYLGLHAYDWITAFF